MKRVGLRELKNRLSEYVRLARRGDIVLVTDRGQVVAELRPPGRAPSEPGDYSRLTELARRGLLTLGGPNEAQLYPAMSRVLAPGRLQRLLDEERGER
jgi:antitoxin (DNA-binding transcriptional repressor) of toxin-antitoxin stability system